MVIGLPKIKFSKGVCQGCILGKHLEHKFEKASHERTFAPLELIHSDVAGPFPYMSMSQAKYALKFIGFFQVLLGSLHETQVRSFWPIQSLQGFG